MKLTNTQALIFRGLRNGLAVIGIATLWIISGPPISIVWTGLGILVILGALIYIGAIVYFQWWEDKKGKF